MSLAIQRLDSPSIETIKALLDGLSERDETYSDSDNWSEQTLTHLPQPIQAFTAADSQGPAALLILCPGVFEAWGAPTDLLGANPILPDNAAADEIHSALLMEAKAWATRESITGLEVFLPMGPANMQRSKPLDSFYRTLGFDRFYYTMTRDISSLNGLDDGDMLMKIVPVSTISVDELYANFAASLAHGEIEFMSSMSDENRREYFESLAEETARHNGSLALLGDAGVIGFTLVTAMPGAGAHLAWIGVLPEHRSTGIGQHLLRKTLARCHAEGLAFMSLYTDTTVDAQSLYRNLGFTPAGALAYRWRRAIT